MRLAREGLLMTDYIDPFVKWAGSKRQLLPTILPLVERALATRTDPIYFEPFLGGGSVALNVDPSVSKILCDLCEPLMAAWSCVQLRPVALATKLASFRSDDATYYRVRENFNMRLRNRRLIMGIDQIAAEFIYLNKHCFNGLWRVNGQGLFNVPYRHQAGVLPTGVQLEAIAERIPPVDKHVLFGQPQHEWLIPHGPGAFLFSGEAVSVIGGFRDAPRPIVAFVDPPYDAVFGDYSKDGFDADDQRELADVLHRFADAGHAVIATNSDTALIRDVYAWADVQPIAERRRIASNGNRDDAACVLITKNV